MKWIKWKWRDHQPGTRRYMFNEVCHDSIGNVQTILFHWAYLNHQYKILILKDELLKIEWERKNLKERKLETILCEVVQGTRVSSTLLKRGQNKMNQVIYKWKPNPKPRKTCKKPWGKFTWVLKFILYAEENNKPCNILDISLHKQIRNYQFGEQIKFLYEIWKLASAW